MARRMITSLTLLAAVTGAPMTVESHELSAHCTIRDQEISQRLYALLANNPKPAPDRMNLLMARMASARSDCKHGHPERGLYTYGAAETELHALEEWTAAGAMSAFEPASGPSAVR